jgi:hypothetical protein
LERLYLVGKSPDHTTLYFASEEAGAPSVEVPITEELLEAIRGATEDSASADEARSILPPALEPPPARPRPRGGLPPGSFERATQLAGRGVEAIIRRPPEHELEPGPPPEPEPEHPTWRDGPRRPSTRLTPAEIQRLLRAGRGIRSVARQAEASEEWIRRLARPIEAERVGVVIQLLRAHQIGPHGPRSALPIGAAIVEHLRERGVRFAERVVEEGWTANRPDGGPWRVRFAYEWRGSRHRAAWCFDPQTGEATPTNEVAATLGFRAPPDAHGVEDGALSEGA